MWLTVSQIAAHRWPAPLFGARGEADIMAEECGEESGSGQRTRKQREGETPLFMDKISTPKALPPIIHLLQPCPTCP